VEERKGGVGYGIRMRQESVLYCAVVDRNHTASVARTAIVVVDSQDYTASVARIAIVVVCQGVRYSTLLGEVDWWMDSRRRHERGKETSTRCNVAFIGA
jgi:hypothetical protein